MSTAHHYVLPLALGLAALAVRPAAATGAIHFIPGAIGVQDTAADAGVDSYSLGFEFITSAPLTVTALGYFNNPAFDPMTPFDSVPLNPENGGGYTFQTSHDVGIYDLLGNLLVFGTVPQTGGTAGGDDFLYTSALTGSPFLAPGDYVLAGVTGGSDPYVFDVQDSSGTALGLATAPDITYVQDRYAVSPTLTAPGLTDPGSEAGFVGPNFQFRPGVPAAAAVPEPSSLALLGLGLLPAGRFLSARRRTVRGRP